MDDLDRQHVIAGFPVFVVVRKTSWFLIFVCVLIGGRSPDQRKITSHIVFGLEDRITGFSLEKANNCGNNYVFTSGTRIN